MTSPVRDYLAARADYLRARAPVIGACGHHERHVPVADRAVSVPLTAEQLAAAEAGYRAWLAATHRQRIAIRDSIAPEWRDWLDPVRPTSAEEG